MAILLNNDGFWHESWTQALQKYLPAHEIVEFPDVPDLAAIEYALVWKHPYGDLNRYPNLKAIMSLGSGTDHLDGDPHPPSAPIYRLIDTAMAEDMALYTLYWVIHFQRQFETYRHQQSQAHWHRFPTPLAHEYNICVLGLGAIGGFIANHLAKNGFKVSGWARSPKTVDGVHCVYGPDALMPVLRDTDVLVDCLPLNPQTRHFIGDDILSDLKKGAHMINVSRGATIDDNALLKLLDSGHIAGAALDVFAEEPLPQSSPFWAHPKVHVTPHMSGATNPDTATAIIADNIKKLERGETPSYKYKR